jgi:hypothetical protein
MLKQPQYMLKQPQYKFKTTTVQIKTTTVQVKTTTVQIKTNIVQDIPKFNSHNTTKYPQYKVTLMYMTLLSPGTSP